MGSRAVAAYPRRESVAQLSTEEPTSAIELRHGAALSGALCTDFTNTRSRRTPRTPNAVRWSQCPPSTLGRRIPRSERDPVDQNEPQHAQRVTSMHRPTAHDMPKRCTRPPIDRPTSRTRARRKVASNSRSRRAAAARAQREAHVRSWPRAQALTDSHRWCGAMWWAWRWAGARACGAAAIARHSAVDLADAPSTICQQCTRVVSECERSRLGVPLILERVRVLGRGLDSHVSRNAVYM